MYRTLSSRLIRWYVGSFLIFLGLAFSITWIVVDRVFDNMVTEELVEDFFEFQQIYKNDGVPGVLEEIAKEDGAERDETEFIRLISAQGHIIGSTDSSYPESITFDQTPIAGTGNYLTGEKRYAISGEHAGETEALQFREIHGNLGNNLIIHIGEHPEGNMATLVILRNSFLLILLFSIPLAVIISRRSIRTSVSGITDITATAEKIRQGHLDERVKTDTVDVEISTLANTFNTMLDRIKELVTEIREMTDNIAHDLKSPLARIRFMSELSLSKTLTKAEQDESAAQTIDECDRLIKMIDMALDVAEAQAGIKNHRDVVIDMSALVTAAVELFVPVAEQHNIALNPRIQSGCRYTGGLENMQRTVSNLIDNAIKYSNSGDRVSVILEYDEDDLNLIVSDTGLGIKEQEQESIFKRFYRCDRTRSSEGCGLGLSYCRAVVRRAGGNLQVTSVYGQGSNFTVTLPVDHRSDRPAVHQPGKDIKIGGCQSSANAMISN